MKNRNEVVRGLLFGATSAVAMVAVLGIVSFGLTYTPPPTKNQGSGYTHLDYNKDWGKLAAFLNSKIGNSNITSADPIARTKLDFDANNDGTANDSYSLQDADIQTVGVSKFTGLKVKAESSPSLQVEVESGIATRADGLGTIQFLSPETSPVFTAPSVSTVRIDMLGIDLTNSLVVYKGNPAASNPIPAQYPANIVPLAEIFLRAGSTQILNGNTDPAQSYIYKDARPIIASPKSRLSIIGQPVVSEQFDKRQSASGTISLPNALSNPVYSDDWAFNDNAGAGADTFPANDRSLLRMTCTTNASKLCDAVSKKYLRILDNGFLFEARIRFNSITTPNCFIGLATTGDSVTIATIADGIYFQCNGTVDHIEMLVEDGNVASCVGGYSPCPGGSLAPTITDFTAWHTYRIVVERQPGATTLWKASFFIDGSLKEYSTDLTDAVIPGDADDRLGPLIGYLGGSASSMDVDYVLLSPLDDSIY